MQKEIVPFGVLDDNKVTMFEFCDDPDGTDLQWFRPTKQCVAIDAYQPLSEAYEHYAGDCYDTGDFFSHAGELLKCMLQQAPVGTKLATFSRTASAGTRTFYETVYVTFYL